MNRAGGIAVRLLRPWHGRPVGAVFNPPGSIRQILLDSKDENGTAFAELVDEQPTTSKPAEQPAFKFKAGKGRR